MMKGLRGVSIALIGLLTVAAYCFAADQPPPSPSPTPAPAPPTPAPPTPPPATPPPAPAAPSPVTLSPSAPSPGTTAVDTLARARPAAATHSKPPSPPEPPNSAHVAGGPGLASLGGGLGLATLLADGDYTNSRATDSKGNPTWGNRDVSLRMSFTASFRYTWSKHFRWQVSPGFLWAGYDSKAPMPFRTAYFPTDSTKANILTLVMPATFEIQYLQRTRTWLYHEGVGTGAYRVWIEQSRKLVEDPVSHKLHNGFYPGLTADFGAEHFLKTMPAVSIEFSTATHLIFAQRDEQFPSGWNSNVWSLDLRFGANYYFNPAPKHSGAH